MGCSTSKSNMEGLKTPLSPGDKVLIKQSWTEFTGRGSLRDLGLPLFVKLFADYPDVKALFSFVKEGGDSPESEAVRDHAEGVMGVVDTAVTSINDLEALVPVVRGLGARHYTYGAQVSQLGPVGECLLFTMESELKEGFTQETKDAWVHFYTFISTHFQEGLEDERRKQG